MKRLDGQREGGQEDMTAPCPFCEVVAGRYAREIVYSDETVIAFLCDPPATWGHLLIVPRQHRADIWDISSQEAAAAMVAAHLLAEVLRSDLEAVGVNLRHNSGSTAGQHVFHFHLHVVPRYPGDTLLEGGVWGIPPWEPPTGGDAEQRHVAEIIRRGVAKRAA
jgi:histidine triad (HIT) family protein